MENDQIVHKITDAKDNFGVITADSLHTQLGSFSADDWKQASKIFSKDASNSGGFYIDDNNGKVTIHNDLSQAQSFTERSVAQHCLDDAKAAGKLMAISIPTTSAALGGIDAVASWSAGLSLAAGLANGAEFALASAAIGTGGTVVGGALLMAADAGYNMYESSVARRDVQGSGTVSL